MNAYADFNVRTHMHEDDLRALLRARRLLRSGDVKEALYEIERVLQSADPSWRTIAG